MACTCPLTRRLCLAPAAWPTSVSWLVQLTLHTEHFHGARVLRNSSPSAWPAGGTTNTDTLPAGITPGCGRVAGPFRAACQRCNAPNHSQQQCCRSAASPAAGSRAAHLPRPVSLLPPRWQTRLLRSRRAWWHPGRTSHALSHTVYGSARGRAGGHGNLISTASAETLAQHWQRT